MKQSKVLSLVALASIVSMSAFAQNKGLEIAKKADAADNGWGDSANTLNMTLKNRHGQETKRQMKSYFLEVKGDGDKSLTVFNTPADVKGTATLAYTHKSGPDDQWLYLPALKRVKRISGSNRSGPFMGSEFAYEDLSSQEVEKYTYKYIKDEKMNGADCHVVERYPVEKTSGYKRQVVWFNKSNYRVEKTDYYDRKNTLLKTLTFSKYKQYLGKYWRANEMKMVNHQNKKQTVLQFTDMKFKTGLTEEDFSQNSLKRAK